VFFAALGAPHRESALQKQKNAPGAGRTPHFANIATPRDLILINPLSGVLRNLKEKISVPIALYGFQQLFSRVAAYVISSQFSIHPYFLSKETWGRVRPTPSTD
jgi:hypothetical protein